MSPPNTAHQHGAGIGGGTKAGQGCVVAGCHLAGNTGAGAPPFTMAGTLYKPDGSTPSAGAEIRLASDAGGTPLVAKTDDAGNFYTGGTVAFPAHTLASGCPTQDAHMSGSIANAGNGNCNGGTACHQVPGGLPMTLADQ
ncbi:MAG TPA: hypothetical protein VFQ53_22880 [Kofleriaceae bacterium]|nr:hypothetical protein [Kofleriaceae bacterium]